MSFFLRAVSHIVPETEDIRVGRTQTVSVNSCSNSDSDD
jgi:hypothetical protein